MTGWTKEWPTEPGWACSRHKDYVWVDPMESKMMGGVLFHCWLGEGITPGSHPSMQFHPMEQPPAPPEVEES